MLGGNRTHARQSNRRGGGYCEGEGRFPSRGRLEFGGVVLFFAVFLFFSCFLFDSFLCFVCFRRWWDFVQMRCRCELSLKDFEKKIYMYLGT